MNRKLIAVLAVISAPMIVRAQDYGSPVPPPMSYGNPPHSSQSPEIPHSSAPAEQTSTIPPHQPTPPPAPLETTPVNPPSYGSPPPPPPPPSTPCETSTQPPHPTETCANGGDNSNGSSIAAVLFDNANFGGERHWIDGTPGECRGLSGVTVGSLKTVASAGADPFTAAVDSQATFEFFDDYNCAGNSIGQVTGSQADLTGTLKPVNSGNSTGPLSVRFVSSSGSGGSNNSTGTGDGDENADALTNGAQSSVMPNSLFAMAIASAFAYLL